MRVGNVHVDVLSDGQWRLDGGAFFGVVPRVLWERQLQPDEKNRVPLHLNCPLIRSGGKTVLVDTGLGNKHPARRAEQFAMDVGKLTADLRAHGVRPEAVDYVVLSHLHWDHAGGATYRDAAGGLHVTFPRAQYLAQRADWEEATHPTERNRAGYYEEDLAPLAQAKQLELLDGDTQVLPGLWCRRTGGHTAGHQIALLDVDGRKACYFGDLCATACHLPLPYSQSYDLYPVDLLDRKRELLTLAEREQWLVLFDHETQHPAGYLERDDAGRLRVKPAPGMP